MHGIMTTSTDFEIFLAAPPGLEMVLADEIRLKGFKRPRIVPGGVTIRGGWPEVWRANLWIRGASRVLARIASFHVRHLAQLDDLARAVEWSALLRPDVPVQVEAHCAGSRLYHSGAVAERIGKAIHATLGAPLAEGDVEPSVTVMARIERDVCVLSLDTSGALLHRRGFKQAVNRAPIRETMAALFLMRCGYTGQEPVVDPMCGSGTFILEAAEIAARLNPGRGRSFAFQHLATYDAERWEAMRAVRSTRAVEATCYGYDRDAGAVRMAGDNAERAGVSAGVHFAQQPISALKPPTETPGLVIVNPPYGARIGEADALVPLYRSFGQVMKERFSGWRVGMVSAVPRLAQATGLPFVAPEAPIPHGGLRVSLYRTDPLA
ncbi:putative N6-adenine-specific DNA methylase [Neokomagataea tanensis NBRC 106556]|uniref:N6-adenine-specific DNA methylase n=2 Tax=Acetobacteraceae TaxID=433 RepID=A0ABQ0QJ21_9PROT|nr:putative N6-adenine-specific DNA methylase [Neokomagataea tanensis NBRC 106556]